MLPAPLLYLSAFFEATREDYYERLRGVTERSEWDAWLEYFLTGVARQAEDALSRATRINDLLVRWRLGVAGIPSKPLATLVEPARGESVLDRPSRGGAPRRCLHHGTASR